jgi:hypothetical protein
MAVDRLDPAGVYFGTRSGKVYASADGGGSWSLVADGLPPVLCVRAVVVGDPAKIHVPPVRGAVKRTIAKVRAKAKAVAKRKPLRKALAKARPKARAR